MTAAIAIALLAPFGLLAVGVVALLRRPRIITGEPKPALILAAHQDDCAILAGAYAIAAKKAGKPVRVAYLTCGASSPDLPRSQMRKRESVSAWGTVNVPAADVLFFDLPEHDVAGHSTLTDADRAGARRWLAGLMGELPPDAVVFLPAAGESHVDHRVLRRLGLEAWRDVRRTDLLFLEGPEYNDYLSLLQSPGKVWAGLVMGMPFLWRYLRRETPAWTGFAGGGAYWTLPPNDALMKERENLLRGFVSENGDLLVRLFGSFERYRPVPTPELGLAQEPPRGYLTVGDRKRGFSALLALVVWAEFLATAAWAVSLVVLRLLGGGGGRVVTSSATLGAIVLGARNRLTVDSRVLYWALAVGALAAVVGGP